MTLVEIRNNADLYQWLMTMPRAVSGIIAARIALRVLPLTLDYIREQPEGRRAALLLPTLRAMASPWAPALGSAQGQKRVRRAAARASLAASLAARASDAAAHAAARASDAASYTARAADAAAHAARAYDAAYAALADNAAFALSADANAAALAADAAALAERLPNLKARRTGQKPVKAACAELANAPLWPEGIPHEMDKGWKNLKVLLADAPEEGWAVWTGWYEDRLAGHRPVNTDLELERILTMDEDWQRGPAHVNGIIKGLMEKHLGGRLPKTLLARLDKTGEIAVAEPEYTDPSEYDRVCDQVADGLAAFPEQSLTNFYVELGDPIRALTMALETRRDVPITVHRRIVQAAAEVHRLTAERDYLRDDFKVKTLSQDLDEAVLTIPVAVPAVREKIVKMLDVSIAGIEPEGAARVRAVVAQIAEVSQPPVRELMDQGLPVLDRHPEGEVLTSEAEREWVFALGWMLFSVGRLGKDLDTLRSRLVDGADQIRKLSGAINAAHQLYQILLRIFL